MDECNPRKPENFIEAINNANDECISDIRKLLLAGNPEALGKYLISMAEDYWIQESESIAEDILFSKGGL